jgi:hypothetical protein
MLLCMHYYYIVHFMHFTIVGGSSNDSPDPTDISVVYTVDMVVSGCLRVCVCVSSRLEVYWLPCLEQLVEML